MEQQSKEFCKKCGSPRERKNGKLIRCKTCLKQYRQENKKQYRQYKEVAEYDDLINEEKFIEESLNG